MVRDISWAISEKPNFPNARFYVSIPNASKSLNFINILPDHLSIDGTTFVTRRANLQRAKIISNLCRFLVENFTVLAFV
jgi:hypothetical protein